MMTGTTDNRGCGISSVIQFRNVKKPITVQVREGNSSDARVDGTVFARGE